MKFKANRTKRILSEGGVCFGTMIRLAKSPHVIPLCAAAGWDFLIADTEHADFNAETVAALALAARYEELGFFVRVPDKWYFQMAQNLDWGADGLVLPRVETTEQVDRILDSVRYFPLGHRGAAISSLATLMRDCSPAEYFEWANSEIMTIVQIESEKAVNSADELLSKPGIDAVLIGPFDLSQDLGVPGEVHHPRVEEACRSVIESCRRLGVTPGIHLAAIEDVAKWLSSGMRFISYQADSKLLLDASRTAVARFRDLAANVQE